MLHFRRLQLKNWRNFREVDVALPDRAFLIGPNASGKSNLLDVFRFLRDLARPGGGLQKAVADRGGLKMIRCLAARQFPAVEVAVELEDPAASGRWRYEIGIEIERGGANRPVLKRERVLHDGRPVLERPEEDDARDPDRRTQTSLEQIAANREFRVLAGAFEGVAYAHLVPQLLRHPEIAAGKVLERDPFGQDFLRRLADTPDKYRKARLNRIGKLLAVTVPQLKDLTYLIDDKEGGLPHLEATYEHWRPHGVRHREREFSDGTLRLIGLLWTVLEGDSLLLLEEPELSLHASVVAKLAGLLDRVNRKRQRQLFVSTHSPELLHDKGIASNEVLLLRPRGEGTEVCLASDLLEVHRLMAQGLSAADAALPTTRPERLDQLDELALF